jgi:3-methyladenine DNA glycosylase AlkD
MTTAQSALSDLQALADRESAAKAAQLHKADRLHLGITNPQIDTLYKSWRADTSLEERVTIAAYLWDSNIHDARIAAAKLLTQARIDPDDGVWTEIQRWVLECDVVAIADQVAAAGARRLPGDPTRLDVLETWVSHQNIWVCRTALTMTLPWAKLNHPSVADLVIRDRILEWAAILAPNHDPTVQKAIAQWLRTLAKHDKPRVISFLDAHGTQLKAFALKEASAKL